MLQDVADLKRIMSPKSVWTIAMGWNMFEQLKDFKKTADDLFHAGNFTNATKWYYSIWARCKDSPIFHLPPEVYESEIAMLVSALWSLLVCAALTDGFCRFKLRDEATVLQVGGPFTEMMNQITQGPPSVIHILGQSFAFQRTIIHAAYLRGLHHVLRDRDVSTLQHVLNRLLSLKAEMPDSEHIVHDFGLVKNLIENGEVCFPAVLYCKRLTTLLLGSGFVP